MTSRGQRPGSFRRPVPLLWAGLALCCAGFVVAFRVVERQRREHVRLDAEIRASETALLQLLNGDFHETPEAFLRAKGLTNPAGAMRFDVDRSRIRVDGEAFGQRYAGWTVRLLLLDRNIVGGLQVRPPPVRPYRGPSNTWRWMEAIRHGTTIIAAAAWVVAMCLFPLARQWRADFAQIALAAVAIAAVAWLADPARSWTLQELRKPWPIALAAVGYVTLFAYALSAPKPKPRRGVAPCADCGYDLTGNVSGVCPECGLVTPQGMIDRWGQTAESIAAIEVAEEPGEQSVITPLSNAPPDQVAADEANADRAETPRAVQV